MKHSEACERNKGPILDILKNTLSDCRAVLEIGSGTGQHAVYFGKHLSHLSWQTSDLHENIEDIEERVKTEGTSNVKPPIELDVSDEVWNISEVDAIFTANTFHIMRWECATDFFNGINKVLCGPGVLCIYGPFKYKGNFTTESNAEFDKWLKNRDLKSGIRDFEEVDKLARLQGLELIADHNMPANNQLLVWRR